MVLQPAEKHILVVDDDRLIVSLLEAGLQESAGNYGVERRLVGKKRLASWSKKRLRW